MLSKFLNTLFIVVILLAPSALHAESTDSNWFDVSGNAVHFFSTSISHSEETVDGGKLAYTTDTIDIKGDLNGRVVYHIKSVFDFQKQTLVNTGHQVFSGTIKGSMPVLILDDQFEFNVKLDTGAVLGKVYLNQTLAGESIECNLTITGTGYAENGDGLADYNGKCRKKQ